MKKGALTTTWLSIESNYPTQNALNWYKLNPSDFSRNTNTDYTFSICQRRFSIYKKSPLDRRHRRLLQGLEI